MAHLLASPATRRPPGRAQDTPPRQLADGRGGNSEPTRDVLFGPTMTDREERQAETGQPGGDGLTDRSAPDPPAQFAYVVAGPGPEIRSCPVPLFVFSH